MVCNGPSSNQLVCQACYHTIFSAKAWQSIMADSGASSNPEGGGYTYTIAGSAIKNAAGTCNWCRLLSKRQVEGAAQVTVRYYKDSKYTPVGDKLLTVVAKDLKDGSTLMNDDLLLYTTRGTRFFCNSREIINKVE